MPRGTAPFIRKLGRNDEVDILDIYRQCQDFLDLGGTTASLAMVRDDMALSHEQNGQFCGIFTPREGLVGIIDYIPSGWEGRSDEAFLELLMIIPPWRRRGLAKWAVEKAEALIRSNPEIRRIRSGVQVNDPRAVRFWLRRGYHVCGGPELMPDGTTVWHLAKELREELQG